MDWHISWSNWQALRADGSASQVPEAINALKNARNSSEAERAYWKIDNTVVTQGVIYPAALDTVPCVLNAFQEASIVAKEYFLELLVQIAFGSPAPYMSKDEGAELKAMCLKEISYGVAIYFRYLRFGTDIERCHCADLLGVCAAENIYLKARVVFFFKELLRIESVSGIKGLLENWILELG